MAALHSQYLHLLYAAAYDISCSGVKSAYRRSGSVPLVRLSASENKATWLTWRHGIMAYRESNIGSEAIGAPCVQRLYEKSSGASRLYAHVKAGA